MCEFVDLGEMRKASELTESEFNIAMWERVKYGFSPLVDLSDFSLFFDEMLLNVFDKILEKHSIHAPKGYTKDSWRQELRKMKSIMCDVVDNSYTLCEFRGPAENFQKLRIEFKERNKELRKEVFDFLTEHVEDLYA